MNEVVRLKRQRKPAVEPRAEAPPSRSSPRSGVVAAADGSESARCSRSFAGLAFGALALRDAAT